MSSSKKAVGPSLDAADEAGGEAIFSSDGLEPLPVPKAPPAFRIHTDWIETESEDASVLDSSPPGGGDPDAVLQSMILASKGNDNKEPPVQRLLRLQREVAELEQELTARSNTGTGGGDDAQQLTQTASELAQRLDQLTGLPPQDELTRIIQQNLLQSTEQEPKDEKSGGIVYELYQSGGQPMPPSTALEQRLLNLEQLVGASSGSQQYSNQSVLQRVELMENLVKRVDSKALDDASMRAKVIRADLEAASKARSKLMAHTSSTQDAKTISALHDQMLQLEGLGAHLPALAHRLQQLASLHLQGATFATRLQSAEQYVQQTHNTLTHLEQALQKLEQGFVDNGHIMEKNLSNLEERLAQL